MNTQSIILARKEASIEYLRHKWQDWDNYEKLFHNSLVTNEERSHVFDPKLSTLLLERAYRVMAQNPSGKVKAISKNDEGSGRLMNLLLDKYILPNAKAQFDFLTKMRMVDIYSAIYGNFFVLVDWDIREDGYVGPDVWLLNIRDVFPQVGAVSLHDSDYVIVRSWQPLSFFTKNAKTKGFKNIDKIVTELKKQGNPNKEDKSERQEDKYTDAPSSPGKGFYEVLTMYEKDKWTDYCVGADMIFREIDNPHDNGELPIVCKYSIPLLDDFMGMGDIERGYTMQNTINSVWNLYLDAVKMSIFPPVLINKDNIAAMSSIKWGAGTKWLVRGQINNTVSPISLSPQGISTFNNTYQVANASLLNMFGTSDTAVTAQTDAGFGKTPEALKMQSSRENTRDNADRFYMEMFVKEVVKKMINLVGKKNPGKIAVRMFKEEIDDLAGDYEEVAEMYDQKTGKLTISNKEIGNILYDYEIVSGSTFAVDEEQQQKNLSTILQMLVTQPNLVQMLAQEGVEIKLGEIFKRMIVRSGISDWDKIVNIKSNDELFEDQLSSNEQVLVDAIQKMSINGVPPQGQMPQGIPQEMSNNLGGQIG